MTTKRHPRERVVCDCGRPATVDIGRIKICERCRRLQQMGGYNNDWVQHRTKRTVTPEQLEAARLSEPFPMHLSREGIGPVY